MSAADTQAEEDDDYMNMSFDQPEPPKPLTSLQRRQQQKRSAEARARPKSKAELAAEEVAARDAALSTSLLEQAAAKKSKGLAMMARMGFKAGSALGAEGNTDARREPINISIKEDRGGVGMENEKRRKLREAFGEEGDEEAVKRKKVEEPGEYRDRMARERERERQERMVVAAQKVAEGMAEEHEQQNGVAVPEESEAPNEDKDARDDKAQRTISSRPLKSINVLWRSLARQREERERDRRMRYDLEQSLSRLPTYDDEDEDEDDKRALGKGKKTVYVAAEDLDEEDPDLDEFNELEPDEKLRRLVTFMRDQWNYCFWCKFKYPDDSMDGCPGLTEDDHD